MSGPIVRSGASPEFSKGWDRIFGGPTPKKAKSAPKKVSKKEAAAAPAKKAETEQAAPPAAKKTAKKAAAKKKATKK